MENSDEEMLLIQWQEMVDRLIKENALLKSRVALLEMRLDFHRRHGLTIEISEKGKINEH